MSATPKKFRFVRFTTRTLLVLMIAAGIWMGLKANRAHRVKKSVAAVEAAGGIVEYRWWYVVDTPDPSIPAIEHLWLEPYLDMHYYADVVTVRLPRGKVETVRMLPNFSEMADLTVAGDLDEDAWPLLGTCTSLEELELQSDAVGDEQLLAIARLPELKTLSLGRSWSAENALHEYAAPPRNRITDRGLAHLSRLEQLESLEFWQESNITNAGLRHLRDLPALVWLRIEGLELDPQGVAHLSQVSQLEGLHVGAISKDAARKLEQLKQEKQFPAAFQIWEGPSAY